MRRTGTGLRLDGLGCGESDHNIHYEVGFGKILPCCDAGDDSVVGEPASAITSRLEMEGNEHLDVSSMGGDGGGCGYP